ncbi:hypothetical protein [Breoghania sp.]|uniref:hypothetical protein n=1 Tax=Breoghania sp. TaxID=2065378 RepID=UPI0026189A37|nr:hypothetical protein [Breoghania sp.]MDJ0933562.1 hypothetical protein [Breoghania sp.]
MVSEHELATQMDARRQMAAMAMPVLGYIAADGADDRPLAGEYIALCGHITEATAV